MGAYHEGKVFQTYLAGLSEAELKTVAYELFVKLQNERALNNSLKQQCNLLEFQNARLNNVCRSHVPGLLIDFKKL
ncbi:hypothetical protein [Trichormus variabilis]|uniref:Uncharacterized protein n=1 Tax=Trichormus variabilis SAG 1403-4b TaxID=447716 RepID=A0A3S1A338_ANAVA|nr:hypothetical protein [Trichormus variabilis]MBD2629894.1 hypothetical protein [Trichormus variabilis FACHB-164]RUS92532.1 hypothetical protein DSM107003_50150 [Trichormus variabilis SAG 1403-4b]